MRTFRIMTYNVAGWHTRQGQETTEQILRVIGEGAPDIVALQGVAGGTGRDPLSDLAAPLGMRVFRESGGRGNAFLSYAPLRGLQHFDLGGGACCLRADFDLSGKRLHLLNLQLTAPVWQRRSQLEALVGPQVLGSRSLSCPVLVLGDFADAWWGPGNERLLLALRRPRRPFWSATFPARFPLMGRDRAYLRGDLRVVETAVIRSAAARHAASHLPLMLTVQITDPRPFLRLDPLSGNNRMRTVPG